MGVFINLNLLPDLIDEFAWTSVYQETLQLINAYPFLSKVVDKNTFDKPWIYVTRAEETKIPVSSDYSYQGWHVIGDDVSMNSAESFLLFRDLNYYRQRLAEPSRPGDDVLFSMLCYYADLGDKVEHVVPNSIGVFDSKTQGHPYHIYILAIACLIEARFPLHAIVYGDVTINQMKKAISWANTILSRPVTLTDRADNEKLLARISAGLADPRDRLEAFMRITLQPKNRLLGDFIRNNFPPEAIEAYFFESFKDYGLTTIGFYDNLKKYFNLGFSLGSACDLCVLSPGGCQYDPAGFVNVVLKMGWRRPGDDEPDLCNLIPTAVNDPDNDNPETVYSLFGKAMARMSGYRDPAESSLTYEEVVSVLQEKLGHLCHVPAVKENDTNVSSQSSQDGRPGLEKSIQDGDNAVPDLPGDSADPSSDEARHSQLLHALFEKYDQESSEINQYDICDMDDLMLWKPGQTISPAIITNLNKVRDYVDEHISKDKDELEDFMNMDNRNKFNVLISLNKYYYIHKKTWDFISENLDNPHVITRLFLIMAIKADELNTSILCKGLINNLDLLREYILMN